MTDRESDVESRLGRPVRIGVIDYGIGNLRSAQKGFERVGAEALLTADPEVIASCDGVVLPGVGNFGACMRALRQSGMAEQPALALDRGQPFLGICVGMQMLFEGSAEAPDEPGLGLVPGRIEWLPDTVKRPQMQWNQLTCAQHPLLDGLDGSWVYFVHSFAAKTKANVLATTTYGGEVVAAIGRDNLMATQFHPEKSAGSGLRLLANFTSIAAQQRTPA